MSHKPEKVPLIEHFRELQIRLTWATLAVIVCGGAAYSMQDTLLKVIQHPLGQTLYYTSPAGGFSFIFKMCIVVGIVLATPVILYQLIKFLGPLLSRVSRATVVAYVIWSMDLALAGVLFSYFVSLPAALHFLANFGGEGIQSLITADEYFNFALAYLGGFAILFQLPLIVIIINKISPLKPGKMMGAQRYIILGSFMISAILTPTPDPINQAIMAVPVVLLYQISLVLVILINNKARRRAAKHIRVSRPVMAAQPVKVAVQPTPAPVLRPAPLTQAFPDIQPVRERPRLVMPRPAPVVSPRRAYNLNQPVTRRLISDVFIPA